MRRLFKTCETGKGNARLLHEAVVFAKPEDLKENKIIDVRPPQLLSAPALSVDAGIPSEMPYIAGPHLFHHTLGQRRSR